MFFYFKLNLYFYFVFKYSQILPSRYFIFFYNNCIYIYITFYNDFIIILCIPILNMYTVSFDNRQGGQSAYTVVIYTEVCHKD